MSYIDYVNRFWQADTERPINPTDTRLYFFLLKTCNELRWKQPFGHSDRHLAVKVGMSINTVRDAKIRLKERGLLAYSTPEVASKSLQGQTQYWFPTVSNNNTVGNRTVSNDDTDTNTPTVSPTDTDGDTVPVPTVSPIDTDGDTVPETNNRLKKTTTNRPDTHEGAGAPSGDLEDKPKKPKKKKGEGGSAAPPKLYTACIDIYDKWHKNENEGEGPQIDGAQGKAMKSIIKYLKTNVRNKNEYFKVNNPQYYLPDITEEQVEARVLESWRMIFDNWHLLRNFYQSRTKLTAINSDIQDILKNIRSGINSKSQQSSQNATGNTGDVRGKGAGVDQLQSYKRD